MLEAGGPDFANVVEFHSLSKRSNLPGLAHRLRRRRPPFLARFLELRNVAAPQVPMPMQQVAIAAYGDEAHVEENRRLYAQKFDLADQIIGDRYGYRRPAGGFFLWLDVSRKAATKRSTLRLWREAGCASCPAAISRASRPTAPIPGGATSALPWCKTSDDHGRGAASPRRGVAVGGLSASMRSRSTAASTPLAASSPIDCRDAAAPAAARDRRPDACSRRGGARARARHLVRARPFAQPRHQHAGAQPARHGGRVVADLLMQLFGVAALALVLPLGIWGWRLVSHRPLSREHMRLAFWLIGIVLAAGFAAALPRTHDLAAADRARRRDRRRPAARAGGRRWPLSEWR